MRERQLKDHLQIVASSSYDDTVKVYASDYSSDEWMVSHSLPPAPPKIYNFPNDPREPEKDESNTGHSSTVWASAFSPDGNYIASCSDDLTVKIWSRFKRKDVKGEPGGAFRVGRTEKEGWSCASTLKGLHERTIFSIDWTEAGNWQPESQVEGELNLGRIATVGGDGKICVIGMTARPNDVARSGFDVHHTMLANVDQAHGVYDINGVQWCRLGRSSSSSSKWSDPKKEVSRWRPPPSDDEETQFREDEEDEEERRSELWKDARNMLATAADDGSVKVWILSTQQEADSEKQDLQSIIADDE